MQHFRRICLTLCVALLPALLGATPVSSQSLEELAYRNRGVLRLSTFATIGSVNKMLTTTEGRTRALERMRQCGVTKVYLDLMRSGQWAEYDNAIAIRDFFEPRGIEVSAGITTSPGEGFGVLAPDRNGYCWSRPETREDLRKLADWVGRGFDEVIVDDFFTSSCRCDICERARGGHDWESFHLARMSRVSQEDLIEPIRALNPDCRIIIKYPQWYDKFHEYGYDIARQVHLFDRVFAGTESRNPTTQRYGYVEPFEGFFNYSWIGSAAGEKMVGAWYDYGDITPDVFREQGYQSVLAGAKEIVLFCLAPLVDEVKSPNAETTRDFIDDGEVLFDLAQTVRNREKEGLHVYKPIGGRGSAGEYYLFDYLGMMGISIVARSNAPQADNVLFSLHAMRDADLPQIVRNLDRAGTSSLTITAGVLEAWAYEPELLEIFGYGTGDIQRETFTADVVQIGTDKESVPQPLEPRFRLTPRDAEAPVTAIAGDRSTPILTAKTSPHGGLRCVLNLSTFSQEDFDAIGEMFLAPAPHPFMSLPRSAVDTIRAHLESTAPRISLPVRCGRYRFWDGLEVWENFNDEPAEVRWDAANVGYATRSPEGPRRIQGITIPPRRFVIVQPAPRD